jgi:hypothetical protein
VPWLWKVGMVILVVCLLASMVIAVVRLSTTPTEILGAGFRGLPKDYHYEAAERRVSRRTFDLQPRL